MGAFVGAALEAFEQGRLVLQNGSLANGWVEVFPELTDNERRLGQLPGFTAEQLDQFLEGFTTEELGLPNNTGTLPAIGASAANSPYVRIAAVNV